MNLSNYATVQSPFQAGSRWLIEQQRAGDIWGWEDQHKLESMLLTEMTAALDRSRCQGSSQNPSPNETESFTPHCTVSKDY